MMLETFIIHLKISHFIVTFGGLQIVQQTGLKVYMGFVLMKLFS